MYFQVTLSRKEYHHRLDFLGNREYLDLLIHQASRRRIERIMKKKMRHNETGNSGCPRKLGKAR